MKTLETDTVESVGDDRDLKSVRYSSTARAVGRSGS